MTQNFPKLPLNLYQGAQVRELDRIAIEECGIDGKTLMERAGTAAFNVIRGLWPDVKNIIVLAGGGNNGGDGYVIARLLKEAGYSVTVSYLVSPENLKGDARLAADKFINTGASPNKYTAKTLQEVDLIVDAMLGTGLDRGVAGEMQSAIEEINKMNVPVFSVDIPSGLHADTGQILGISVRADATITFIGLKQGLFTGQGPACTGKIYFNDLQVPARVYENIIPTAQRMDIDDQKKLLKKRSRSAHKGDFGHVLVIGGDKGFIGAVRMAAEAAGRVGAGLVSVATRSQHAANISISRPEIMAHGIDNEAQLSVLLEKANVIAIGPGLGQSEWSQMLLSRTLENKLPLVVDADALNLLAADPVKKRHWILTPHPGEAARLLGCKSSDVQNERFTAISKLQKKYDGVIVLKGSGTLVIDPEQNISICSAGNPGMASGGMGDVLTGVIAGLLAQGYSLPDAARLGVTIHATAADLAAKEGERGMLAMDLMPYLRQLVNDY